MKEQDPYKGFGLRRVINASTSLTRLGGSMPSPEVFRAMEEASRAFTRIPPLQSWAGRRLAEALGAEAGLPTASAESALILAVAACMMKGTELERYDPLQPQAWTHIIQRIPMHTEGLRTEFIVLGNSRSEYDYAIECAGGRIIEAGSKDEVTVNDLRGAFAQDMTAAYYYTVQTPRKQIPLKDVIKTAHDNGVPIIVDAAPNLTHKRVPRELLREGADLVAFSGGKQLGGLNCTGILLGRRDLVKLAHLQSYPFDGIGRGAKMSRETIVGLVKSLELFMERDDEAYYKALEAKTLDFARRLNEIPGIRSGVTYEPTAVKGLMGPSYAYIELKDESKITLRRLHELLLEGDPPIETLYEPFFVIPDAAGRITLKAEYLLEGDEQIIIERIRHIMTN